MTHAPIPPTVRAGFRSYAVTRSVAAVPEAERRGLDGYAGKTFHTDHVLWVAPDLAHGEARETYLHELMHAGLAGTGAQRSLERLVRTDPDADPEEVYVAAIASTLLALLDGNPQVRAWLWPTG